MREEVDPAMTAYLQARIDAFAGRIIAAGRRGYDAHGRGAVVLLVDHDGPGRDRVIYGTPAYFAELRRRDPRQVAWRHPRNRRMLREYDPATEVVAVALAPDAAWVMTRLRDLEARADPPV